MANWADKEFAKQKILKEFESNLDLAFHGARDEVISIDVAVSSETCFIDSFALACLRLHVDVGMETKLQSFTAT